MKSPELPPEERYSDDDVSGVDIRAEAQANRRKLVEEGELLTPGGRWPSISNSRWTGGSASS